MSDACSATKLAGSGQRLWASWQQTHSPPCTVDIASQLPVGGLTSCSSSLIPLLEAVSTTHINWGGACTCARARACLGMGNVNVCRPSAGTCCHHNGWAKRCWQQQFTGRGGGGDAAVLWPVPHASVACVQLGGVIVTPAAAPGVGVGGGGVPEVWWRAVLPLAGLRPHARSLNAMIVQLNDCLSVSCNVLVALSVLLHRHGCTTTGGVLRPFCVGR